MYDGADYSRGEARYKVSRGVISSVFLARRISKFVMSQIGANFEAIRPEAILMWQISVPIEQFAKCKYEIEHSF